MCVSCEPVIIEDCPRETQTKFWMFEQNEMRLRKIEERERHASDVGVFCVHVVLFKFILLLSMSVYVWRGNPWIAHAMCIEAHVKYIRLDSNRRQRMQDNKCVSY